MDKYVSADTIWVLIGAFLVFSMQPGFAMVETGFTRAKNAGNIVMKNVMDMCLGSIVFWVLGFGLMFGTDIGGFIGTPDFFVKGDYGASYPSTAYFIFQTMFCATAATIVSGAMAERTNFLVYCIYSVLISAIIYPISGHWIWGGGWLAQMDWRAYRQIQCRRYGKRYSRSQHSAWCLGRFPSLVRLVWLQRCFHRLRNR